MKKQLIIVIGVLLLFGCKKYDEGPFLTLRQPEQRITGVWDVQEYLIDAIDSTAALKSKKYHGQIRFNYQTRGISYNLIILGGGYTIGTWELIKRKNKIQISTTNNHVDSELTPPLANERIIWNIKRLTNKEFWLETSYNNKLYRMKLIKVEE